MLNEELSWTEVGALSTGSGSVRDAFQLAFGDPTTPLASNSSTRRLISSPLRRFRPGACWFPVIEKVQQKAVRRTAVDAQVLTLEEEL